jgi:octaprenyl-diphosphate synthase
MMVSEKPQHAVLESLERVAVHRDSDDLAARLGELRVWLAQDLADVERALGAVGVHGDTVAERAGRHLLDASGKRIRPVCVALAARAGSGFGDAAKNCAVAVELVHNATLLHDDVVDLGEARRGAPTARLVYGNAASIFAGDWLLVEALFRIQAARLPGVLDRGLEVIREMVFAEAMQLDRRGKVKASLEDYFAIVRGKTASLFRWARFAGARAGQVSPEACAALESYGENLGVAFQLVDDVLDFATEEETTGKTVMADLREGKMTYPLIVAMERDGDLAPILEGFCASEPTSLDPALARRVARAIASSQAVDDCLAAAGRLCAEAIAALRGVPRGRARDALEAVAVAMPRRRR